MKKKSLRLIAFLLSIPILFCTYALAEEQQEATFPEGLAGHWSGAGVNQDNIDCTADITIQEDGTGIFVLTIGQYFQDTYPIQLDVSSQSFTAELEGFSNVGGIYSLEDGQLHVEYTASENFGGFVYSYVFECERAGILPDIVWMGHTLRADAIEPADERTRNSINYMPKGDLVSLKLIDAESSIPTEDLIEENIKAIKLMTEEGEECTPLFWTYWGVGFDAEKGTFYSDPMQEGFSIIFDIPANTDFGSLILVSD